MNDRGPNDSVNPERAGVTRREVLRKSVIVGGAAFVIPVVETISMSRAAAQSTSQGPNNINHGPPPGGKG